MKQSIFFFFIRHFLGYCKFRLDSWVPEKLNLTVFVSFSIALVKGCHFSLPFCRQHFYYFQYLSLYIGKQHRQLWSETVSNSEYVLIIFSTVFQSLVKGNGAILMRLANLYWGLTTGQALLCVYYIVYIDPVNIHNNPGKWLLYANFTDYKNKVQGCWVICC